MLFFGLELVAAAKLLAAHSAHAAAAKAALATQHPLPAATHVAIHHGVTYAITHPPVSTATTVPALHPGATATLLSHGPATATRAGTTAASPAPMHVLHAARELAMPVGAGIASQQVRKTKQYRQAKAALSERFHQVEDELRAAATS